MKKILAFLLVFAVFIAGCTSQTQNTELDISNEGELTPVQNPDTETPIEPPQNEPGDTSQNPNPQSLPQPIIEDPEEVEEMIVEPDPEPIAEPVPEPVAQVKEFRIDSDDSAFYDESGSKITNLELDNGDEVKITFFIRKTGTYFGGMTIRGPDFDSGKLDKEEEYVVEFTADGSHKIKSYWPATNKLKATLNVNVN